MLNLFEAVKDALILYRQKLVEMTKYVLPLLLMQDAITLFVRPVMISSLPSWLSGGVLFVLSQTLSALAIYVAITVCMSETRISLNDMKWTPGRLFVIWFSTLYLGLAVDLASLLFVIPGLIIMGLSLFNAIYIVQYGQGPIEALASSVDATKKSWVQVTVMISLLALAWSGVSLTDYEIGRRIGDGPIVEMLLAVPLYVVYMYSYPITVAAWKQIGIVPAEPAAT